MIEGDTYYLRKIDNDRMDSLIEENDLYSPASEFLVDCYLFWRRKPTRVAFGIYDVCTDEIKSLCLLINENFYTYMIYVYTIRVWKFDHNIWAKQLLTDLALSFRFYVYAKSSIGCRILRRLPFHPVYRRRDGYTLFESNASFM